MPLADIRPRAYANHQDAATLMKCFLRHASQEHRLRNEGRFWVAIELAALGHVDQSAFIRKRDPSVDPDVRVGLTDSSIVNGVSVFGQQFAHLMDSDDSDPEETENFREALRLSELAYEKDSRKCAARRRAIRDPEKRAIALLTDMFNIWELMRHLQRRERSLTQVTCPQTGETYLREAAYRLKSGKKVLYLEVEDRGPDSDYREILLMLETIRSYRSFLAAQFDVDDPAEVMVNLTSRLLLPLLLHSLGFVRELALATILLQPYGASTKGVAARAVFEECCGIIIHFLKEHSEVPRKKVQVASLSCVFAILDTIIDDLHNHESLINQGWLTLVEAVGQWRPTEDVMVGFMRAAPLYSIAQILLGRSTGKVVGKFLLRVKNRFAQAIKDSGLDSIGPSFEVAKLFTGLVTLLTERIGEIDVRVGDLLTTVMNGEDTAGGIGPSLDLMEALYSYLAHNGADKIAPRQWDTIIFQLENDVFWRLRGFTESKGVRQAVRDCPQDICLAFGRIPGIMHVILKAATDDVKSTIMAAWRDLSRDLTRDITDSSYPFIESDMRLSRGPAVFQCQIRMLDLIRELELDRNEVQSLLKDIRSVILERDVSDRLHCLGILIRSLSKTRRDDFIFEEVTKLLADNYLPIVVELLNSKDSESNGDSPVPAFRSMQRVVTLHGLMVELLGMEPANQELLKLQEEIVDEGMEMLLVPCFAVNNSAAGLFTRLGETASFAPLRPAILEQLTDLISNRGSWLKYLRRTSKEDRWRSWKREWHCRGIRGEKDCRGNSPVAGGFLEDLFVPEEMFDTIPVKQRCTILKALANLAHGISKSSIYEEVTCHHILDLLQQFATASDEQSIRTIASECTKLQIQI